METNFSSADSELQDVVKWGKKSLTMGDTPTAKLTLPNVSRSSLCVQWLVRDCERS